MNMVVRTQAQLGLVTGRNKPIVEASPCAACEGKMMWILLVVLLWIARRDPAIGRVSSLLNDRPVP